MRVYCILHRNSICHLLRTSRDNFCPLPQSFRKAMDNIFMYSFEEYLLSLSYFQLKFGLQIMIVSVIITAKCWSRESAVQRAAFAPPPPHQEVINAIL